MTNHVHCNYCGAIIGNSKFQVFTEKRGGRRFVCSNCIPLHQKQIEKLNEEIAKLERKLT